MLTPSLQRRSLTLLTVGALAVASAGCEISLDSEGVTSTETKTFQVSGQPDVVLETFDGAIEIHSWDRDTIEVEIEKRAMEQDLLDQIEIVAEQEGDHVVVRVTGPPSRELGIVVGSHVSPTALLRVALPRRSNVQASSGDGSVAIEDVSGTVGLETGDGSVRAVDLSGDIRVRTGDGSIRMERIDGRLDLETTDGSIVIEATPTVLRGHTGDGAIRARIASDAAMEGDWELSTGDGSITLTLPSDFNAMLDAQSGDGSVRASHPAVQAAATDGTDDPDRRRTLRATMGTGGRLLRIRTGDGSIRIED